MGLETHLVALKDARFEMGLGGKPPNLLGNCALVPLSAVEPQSSA